MAAALSIRWHRELSTSASAAGLRPIRMLVLVYPLLQLVNSSTASSLAHADLVHRRVNLCRVTRHFAFPERRRDSALLRALCTSNHTTRATRERLAPYFHFGPVDGSEDPVSECSFCLLHPVRKHSNYNYYTRI